MIYLPSCVLSVKAKLSVRQGLRISSSFLPVFLHSFLTFLTPAQKKFFKGTRSEPWWQRHVKMEVGVKLGIFSVWIDRKIHFSLPVLSLRSVTERQIGFLMEGKKHKQKHFYTMGLQHIFIVWGYNTALIFKLNSIKCKITSHLIWSFSCQPVILLIFPPHPAYSWTWCGSYLACAN